MFCFVPIAGDQLLVRRERSRAHDRPFPTASYKLGLMNTTRRINYCNVREENLFSNWCPFSLKNLLIQ